MTNSEAIEELSGRYLVMSMCVNMESCRKSNEALDIAIKAIQENDKIKAEIDELKSHIVDLNYKISEMETDATDILKSNVLLKNELAETKKQLEARNINYDLYCDLQEENDKLKAELGKLRSEVKK